MVPHCEERHASIFSLLATDANPNLSPITLPENFSRGFPVLPAFRNLSDPGDSLKCEGCGSCSGRNAAESFRVRKLLSNRTIWKLESGKFENGNSGPIFGIGWQDLLSTVERNGCSSVVVGTYKNEIGDSAF